MMLDAFYFSLPVGTGVIVRSSEWVVAVVLDLVTTESETIFDDSLITENENTGVDNWFLGMLELSTIKKDNSKWRWFWCQFLDKLCAIV